MKYYLKENFHFFYASGQIYDSDNLEKYTYDYRTVFFPHIDVYKKGQLIGHVKRNFSWFLKKYDIFYKENFLGSINQRFTFLRSKMILEELNWRIEGDLFDWHYKIYDENDRLIAQADQEIFRLTQRFYIEIYDYNMEEMIMLLVIAINQFDKERASSAATSASSSSRSR